MTAGALSADAWTEAGRQLDGLPGGRGLNIAHEALDRHVLHGEGGRVALRTIDADGTVGEVTYAELNRRRVADLRDDLAAPGAPVWYTAPTALRKHGCELRRLPLATGRLTR